MIDYLILKHYFLMTMILMVPMTLFIWVDNGANYDEWNLDPFIKDINKLLSEPLDFIVLDYPFAYKAL